MIIAHHAIFTTYGTWLPNDPRGSFSKAIYSPYLRQLGAIQYGRQDPQPESSTLRRYWRRAEGCLSRPPFFIDDKTRPRVAAGFGRAVARLGLHVVACAIMNDHAHVLTLRSKHTVEYVVGQLKGAATRALGRDRTAWARSCWKVFVDDVVTLHAAILYVEDNPRKSGLPPQRWPFVTPLPPHLARRR